MYLAAQNGMSSTVELLGEMKADVNHALEARAILSRAAIVTVAAGHNRPRPLTERALLRCSQVGGHTPLHIAAQEGFVSTVVCLHRLGADYNRRNSVRV